MLQVAALCRVAPVAMYIHVPGNVDKDFFVRCSPLDDGQYILFMTGEDGHLTSFPALAVLHMHEEGSILSGVHITHPQIAQFCPPQSTGLCKSDMRLPMRRLEVSIMAGRAT